MDWYLKVLKQYADFNGRARRKEYWMFALISSLISWAIQIIGLVLKIEILTYLPIIYTLAVLIPSLAVAVRRLHDIDKSGWMICIVFIPLIGAIWLIVLLCKEGTQGQNKYGADPKNPVNELDEIGTAQA